ncbi:hypothetical protein ACFSCX_18160 [Bacillus salitolerans]|uniref:Uncharacterized protein n=1 Tax=Bacillus salitolerans TaxID=1437434 RepID=A0ABW4LTQ0_9BACI
MYGYTITKRKQFDSTKFLISLSFILILSCSFLPFVTIYSYQDIFINQGESWFFGTPNQNYLYFAGALIYFSILIFVFLFYRNRNLMNDKKVRKFPFIILSLPGFLLMFMTCYHFYYFNDEGIYVSPFSQLHVNHYAWDEVVDATQMQEVRNGVMYEADLMFTFENGDIFKLPVDSEVRLHKKQIYQKLRKQGIEVRRVISQ